MQGKKTVEFWNQYHQQKTNQEWIVNPSSTTLINTILSLSQENQGNNQSLSMLEIGCGTSELGKEIYNLTNQRGRFVITDISPICIETNMRRDEELIIQSKGNFTYKILDAASNNDTTLNGHQFSLVLDKGCLDTFLFRSERRMHYILAENLLNRIHSWMIKYYLVISPRSKIKVLRDFQGFEKIERYTLDDNLADLETNNSKKEVNCSSKQKQVYLYICSKNNDYIPGIGPAFVDCYEKKANDELETTCQFCGMHFDDFCKGLSSTKRIRQWKGHRDHCTDTS